MQNDYSDELPIGDIEYLKRLAKTFKEHRNETGNLEFFFSFALMSFYDCMWEGLGTNAGHVVYRLSDFISEEERSIIKIYPSKDGSIIDEKIYPWASLEDWRKEWEELYHSNIPDFTKKLPSSLLELFVAK